MPHPNHSHPRHFSPRGRTIWDPKGHTLIFDKADGHFTWAGVSRLTADTLVSTGYGPEASRLLEACLWLEEHLSGAVPTLAKDIEAAAEEEGIKRETLKRAKKMLGVRSIRSGTFTEPVWHWKLPDLPILSPPLPPDPLEPLATLEPLEPLELLRENQLLTDIPPRKHRPRP